MYKIPFGPTYEEMLHPSLIGHSLRKQAIASKKDELDPLNLFNITWKNDQDQIHKIVLPKRSQVLMQILWFY